MMNVYVYLCHDTLSAYLNFDPVLKDLFHLLKEDCLEEFWVLDLHDLDIVLGHPLSLAIQLEAVLVGCEGTLLRVQAENPALFQQKFIQANRNL